MQLNNSGETLLVSKFPVYIIIVDDAYTNVKKLIFL